MEIKDKYKAFAMVGKPGSGKGTQSELLSKLTGFEAFSSGHRFRDLAAGGGPLGEKIGGVINNGGLMPYWFASFVFEEKVLYSSDDKGIIFDGVGRTAPEAKLFHDVMTWLRRPYAALCLNVSDESILKRLEIRRQTEGRKDDDEEAIKHRFDEYRQEVVPAINVFREHGTVIDIDGDQDRDRVFEEIVEKLQNA